jgi:hypothetical protein
MTKRFSQFSSGQPNFIQWVERKCFFRLAKLPEHEADDSLASGAKENTRAVAYFKKTIGDHIGLCCVNTCL